MLPGCLRRAQARCEVVCLNTRSRACRFGSSLGSAAIAGIVIGVLVFAAIAGEDRSSSSAPLCSCGSSWRHFRVMAPQLRVWVMHAHTVAGAVLLAVLLRRRGRRRKNYPHGAHHYACSSSVRSDKSVPGMDGYIDPADIVICKRPDGSDWLLGQGSFGQVCADAGSLHTALKQQRSPQSASSSRSGVDVVHCHKLCQPQRKVLPLAWSAAVC